MNPAGANPLSFGLAQRVAELPGATQKSPLTTAPHPRPESLPAPDPICTFLRGNRSFKPAWSGRRACKPRAPGGCTGVSRRQLPADLHAGLAAERPPRPSHRRQWPRGRGPVLACSRIHTLPAEGGSRSSSLRRFCPPTPHPRRLCPLPFLAPLGQGELQAQDFLFHGEKQRTKPKLCSPFSTSVVKRGRIVAPFICKREILKSICLLIAPLSTYSRHRSPV